LAKKLLLIFVLLSLIPASGFGECVLDAKNFMFSVDTYLRTDAVTWRNVTSLNDGNKDDRTAYLGIDYNFALDWEFKNNGPHYYIKLERNGPYDYDAPLFIHNTLLTSGGEIARYRNKELLPQVEEFWLDFPLAKSLRFKTGLYTYEVGNGFSLNGSYENYSATLYQESENFSWRLYYCRPDMVNKTRRGPVVRQEKEQGIVYEPNAANFFALDARIKSGEQCFSPYLGVLADYTSPGKRWNLFSAPINRDLLGTFGLAWELKNEKISLKAEAAKNFGQATSSSADFKDIEHTGYLAYAGIEALLDKLTPYLKFIAASGNKLSPDMASSGAPTLTSGKNRAFSYNSPTNLNTSDSISSSNVDMFPIVAMGGGYGLNYGVQRPSTFFAGDFENLIMPCIGLDYKFSEKLNFSLCGYYLSSFEKGVGTWQGEGKYLSRDLGWESDVFIDYQLNKNILLSFLGGYFFPGGYYKERRNDVGGSLFSPYLRGDGDADGAYQLELALECKF